MRGLFRLCSATVLPLLGILAMFTAACTLSPGKILRAYQAFHSVRRSSPGSPASGMTIVVSSFFDNTGLDQLLDPFGLIPHESAKLFGCSALDINIILFKPLFDVRHRERFV